MVIGMGASHSTNTVAAEAGTARPGLSSIAVAQTEAEALAIAASHGFEIPPACLPGVMANLELLGRHAALLLGEPAP